MAKRRVVKRIRNKRRKGYRYLLCLLTVVFVTGVLFVFKLIVDDKNDSGGAASVVDVFKGQMKNVASSGGYAISTSNPEAADAGEKILKAGGNAVDAAVAMAYTLSVTEPYGSGLGGGGCMVIYDPETEDTIFYDYSAEAPASGSSSKILVPGFVSGMKTVRENHGTMEFQQLLEPALDYCDGFEVNQEFETRIERVSGMLHTSSAFYLKDNWITEGETLTQSELKETLEILRENGEEDFYSGTIADMIVQNTSLSKEDLQTYETIISEPVTGTYRDYEITAAAAPYSGTTLIQMLKMMEELDIENPNENEEKFLEKLETATLAAHADRTSYVYDLRFGQSGINEGSRIEDEYIQELLGADIHDVEIEQESEDTTGFTVIDKNGMVVACTNTLSHFLGSKVCVGGFYMNNTGVNFGSGVNSYEAGKRPRTHITPTILKNDDEVIAIASPGGSVIVKVLAAVLTDICRFDTDAQEAVDKQRVYFESEGLVYYETGYETKPLVKAAGCGYSAVPVTNHSSFGSVAISGYKEDSGFYAVKDIRRGGAKKAVN